AAADWSIVLRGEVRQDVDAFLAKDAELHEYDSQIQYYSKYVEKASHVPTSNTLHAFRIEYNMLREGLLTVSSSYVKLLKDRLIDIHRKNTHDLDEKFDVIHKRLQETPESTAQLFKLMEYVEQIRRIKIHGLAEDVANMVNRLKVILDLVHLTADDVAVTAAVIVWPAKLKPVIEHAVESLEDFKQEFEERLVEQAGEVTHTLKRIKEFVSELEDLSDVAHANKYIREVHKLEGRLEKVEAQVTWVNQEEALFKFPLSSFPDLEELKACLVPYEELFTLVMKWRKYEKHWMDGDFTSLDPDFIDVETEELSRELFRLRKGFKMKFKQQALEGDAKKARMNLDDPNPDNLPGPLRVCALALNQIKSFKEHLALVSALCNKGLRTRHWELLNEAAGFDITPNAGTSLRKVVGMELGGLLKEFQVVSSAASREYNLELSLAQMRDAWEKTTVYPTMNVEVEMEILGGLEEVRALVEDHFITTHTIKNSPFVGPFADDVKSWEAMLLIVKDALFVWMKVQSIWVELTPVFNNPDLPDKMPEENLLFREVDKKWREVMDLATGDEQLLRVLAKEDTLREMTTCLETMAVIQRAVNIYLDNKRNIFFRLFFLSNEELTALICEKDMKKLETHLRKVFEGVHSLQLDQNNKEVEGVISIEGERLQLNQKVSTGQLRTSIENWLLNFQDSLTGTLQNMTSTGVEDWGQTSRRSRETTYLPPWPLQVLLTVRHVYWTAEVHQAIRGGGQALCECLQRVE
ncbi:unnamed protein product, partial [Meganyctiphanes norvegica]